MGQGASVANLANHTLLTGMGEAKDKLQSCQAVILVNTNTHAGGLYHFPAGSINTDGHSKTVLTEIAAAITPDMAYIVFGVAPLQQALTFTSMAGMASGHTQNMEQLRSFVRTLLPSTATIRSKKATGGVASVTWHGGAFVIGLVEIDTYTDLRDEAAGVSINYTVYGQPL